MIQKQNKNKTCLMAKRNSHMYYAWDWLNVMVHVVDWCYDLHKWEQEWDAAEPHWG